MNMSCEQFNELLDRYIDGELTESEKEGFLRHAESCEVCKAALEAANFIKDELDNCDENFEIPQDVKDRVYANVEKEISAKPQKKPVIKVLRGFYSLAAAFILMVGITFGLRDTGVLNSIMPANQDSSMRFMITDSSVSAPEAKSSVMGLHADGDTEEAEITEEAAALTSESAALSDTADELLIMTPDNAALKEEEKESDLVLARGADVQLKSQDLITDVSLIEELTEDCDGYIETETRDMTKNSAAQMVIRVPVEELDNFLVGLDKIGEAVKASKWNKNVKENIYDAKARLEAANAEQARLLELMATAGEKSIVVLGDELEKINAKRDALLSEIAGFENDLKYAKVVITISEIGAAPIATPEPTLGEKVKNGFTSSMSAMGDFFADMLVALGVIAPIVIVILAFALVIGVIVVIVKKKRK